MVREEGSPVTEQPYSRGIVDARFEAIRHEWRADLAHEIGTLRHEMAVEFGTMKRDFADLAAQVRMWGFGLALVIPVVTLIINKLWH